MSVIRYKVFRGSAYIVVVDGTNAVTLCCHDVCGEVNIQIAAHKTVAVVSRAENF